MECVVALCAERGPDVALRIERFAASPYVAQPDAENRPFELELAEQGIVVNVPADRTALEVVQEILPEHPYSCLGGQCGTCLVTVLAGEVDHRDEVLSPEEHESNSAMTLCVSRAVSDRIVIKL
jgi:tetrachlorobenzoquinone reductase